MATIKERFPIGEFESPSQFNSDLVEKWIEIISIFPQKL